MGRGWGSCRYAAAQVVQHCVRSFRHDGGSGCAERIPLQTEAPEEQHSLVWVIHPDYADSFKAKSQQKRA